MKKCSACGIDKPFTDFGKWSKAKDGMQPRCKECAREYGRQNYANNPKRKEQVRRADQIGRARAKDYIVSIKQNSKCWDCGERDFVVLEFDHLGQKKHNIADMVRKGFSLSTIQLEIAKCQVVCANCHRRRTMDRLTGARKDAMIVA